jgi:membrane protease YdiL (CAAX protease family)
MQVELKPVDVVLALLTLLGVAACVATWAIVAVRWRRRLPVLPYQPRRSVPWRLGDVLLVVLLYLLGPSLLWLASQYWLGAPPPSPPAQLAEEPRQAKQPQRDKKHPAERVLMESRNTRAIVTCALLVVVIAPIAEEILFRLILQGWLEMLERRLCRRMGRLRRLAAGVVPVGLTSLMFAALHSRAAAPRDVSELAFAITIQAVACPVTISLALCWLRFAVGATAADFGLAPARPAGDVRLGLAAFLAVTAPVLALNVAAQTLLPDLVVDPIPLFVLAVVLGTIYYRTHRILPCIVLHMAFNALGVAGAFLSP